MESIQNRHITIVQRKPPKVQPQARYKYGQPSKDSDLRAARSCFVQELSRKKGLRNQGYHLINLVGQGRWGFVFEAEFQSENPAREESSNGRRFALKFLKTQQSFNEISLQSRLGHPNIIKSHSSFIVQRTFRFQGVYIPCRTECIVLDFYESITLQDMISKGKRRLTDAEIGKIIVAVAGALKYLRSKGVVHRDLHPGNILVGSNSAKIGDFGLSRPLKTGGRLCQDCGTPGYKAPEVVDGSGYDHGADTYGLGVLLYVMLVGSLSCFIDGTCQWPNTLNRPVSREGRELVEAILVKASDRPELDDIVGYPFIAGSNQKEHQERCQAAGVGRKSDGEVWPCVGAEECENSVRKAKAGHLGFLWA